MTKEKLQDAVQLHFKLARAEECLQKAWELGEGMEGEIVRCLGKVNRDKEKSLHDRIKEEVICELNKAIKGINYEIEHL